MEKKGFFKRKRDEYLALDRLDRKRYVTDGILNNALYILMVIFIIYTAIRNKNFLSPSSIANMLMLAAVSLPMALGIGGCIVLTGTDLSAGRVFGLAAGMSAAFLQNRAATKLIFEHLPSTTGGWIIAVMLMVMVAGAVIGLVNGFFVAKFSLHPFIVTLATQLITYGIILMFFQINGNGGGPISNIASEFKNAIAGPAFKIAAAVAAAVIAIIVVLVLMTRNNKKPAARRASVPNTPPQMPPIPPVQPQPMSGPMGGGVPPMYGGGAGTSVLGGGSNETTVVLLKRRVSVRLQRQRDSTTNVTLLQPVLSAAYPSSEAPVISEE